MIKVILLKHMKVILERKDKHVRKFNTIVIQIVITKNIDVCMLNLLLLAQ